MRYYIIHITYVVPQSEVELIRPEHRKYLQLFYDKGVMLMNGPQVPPSGGILLAKAESDEIIRSMIADDPYNIKGIATYEVIEMKPAMWAAELGGIFS